METPQTDLERYLQARVRALESALSDAKDAVKLAAEALNRCEGHGHTCGWDDFRPCVRAKRMLPEVLRRLG